MTEMRLSNIRNLEELLRFSKEKDKDEDIDEEGSLKLKIKVPFKESEKEQVFEAVKELSENLSKDKKGFTNIMNLDDLLLKYGQDLEIKEGVEVDTPCIYLVRHAKTALNDDNDKNHDKIRGWIDVPLSDEGRQQSKEMAQQFNGVTLSKVYCSDLSRAYDTAKDISEVTGAPIETTVGLRPWNLGVLQGKESKKAAEYLENYITVDKDKVVPEGESFNSFMARCLDTFNQIVEEFKKNRENVALVTHYRDVKLLQSWQAAGSKGYEIDEKEFLDDHVITGSIFSLIISE